MELTVKDHFSPWTRLNRLGLDQLNKKKKAWEKMDKKRIHSIELKTLLFLLIYSDKTL